ncbi:npp1 domain-containing protein [Stachybotrys elegans]|uniref:Npp1 domain-containing protein n=1 Tax=Stachybotrys elegans TaxID=80388 RepID=A0A8K0SIM5_9HYPO|nr:npp1 domain-containing protein [Stachybotrys elegans]
MHFLRAIAFLAVGLGVSAGPLARRDTINHDAVVGFPQTVPSGATGQTFLKFKPWLLVNGGCVPFPAVDAAGNTGGGLRPGGGASSGCSGSTGQVYVRGAWQGSRYAIMYAWYFPKDGGVVGHRHDWESIIVWINNPEVANPVVQGISTSAHGNFNTIRSNFPLDGTRPKIRYYTKGVTNFELTTTSTRGGEQPLIAWDSLPAAARNALQNTNFGDANVPMRDPNFADNLREAAF